MVKLDDEFWDTFENHYGITYSVKHASPPNKEIVDEQYLPRFCLSVLSSAIKLEINAHAPDMKGNSVSITLPMESLRLLLHEADRKLLEQKLKARLEKSR